MPPVTRRPSLGRCGGAVRGPLPRNPHEKRETEEREARAARNQTRAQ